VLSPGDIDTLPGIVGQSGTNRNEELLKNRVACFGWSAAANGPRPKLGGETRRRRDAAAEGRGGGEPWRRRDAAAGAARRCDAAAEGRGGGGTRRRWDAAAAIELGRGRAPATARPDR
jgi:hypothetical protein